MKEPLPEEETYMKRVHAQIGNYLLKFDAEKALQYFEHGVSILPNDKFCLTGRAKAKMQNMDISGALVDVEKVLQKYPNDLRVQALRNEIIYLKKDFEDSLMLNERLLSQRRHPDDFFKGQMKCRDAIKNSVLYERSGHPLRDHFEIIRRIAWLKQTRQPEPLNKRRGKGVFRISDTSLTEITQRPHSGSTQSTNTVHDTVELHIDALMKEVESEVEIVPSLYNYPYSPLQKCTTNIANYVADIYLQDLHKQKKYLEELPTRSGFSAYNEKMDKKMRELIEKRVEYVDDMQNFLRSNRPFYHITFKQKTEAVQRHKKMVMEKKISDVKYNFLNILSHMRKLYKVKDLVGITFFMNEMIKYCRRLSRKMGKRNETVISNAVEIAANAHFNFMLFDSGMNEEEKQQRIAAVFPLELGRSISSDSFFQNANKFQPVNWKNELAILEGSFKNATTPEEILYLYYECGRIHYQMNHLLFSKSYSTKCILAAKKLKNVTWSINGQILLSKCHLKQFNKVDALKCLEKALVTSKTLKMDGMRKFLEFAINFINIMNFSRFVSSKRVINKRQMEVMKILKINEKNFREAELLFRKMDHTRPERTLSILPGYSLAEDRKQRGPRVQKEMMKKDEKLVEKKRGFAFTALIKDFL